MSLFLSSLSRCKFSGKKFYVKAVTLTLALGAIEGTALASSWNSQPSWANGAKSDEYSAPSRKPSNASAQPKEFHSQISPFSPDSNNVSLDVGQTFLMGQWNNTNYADSIGAQVHYTYGVSDIFGFDSSFGYSNHSDGKFSMTSLLTGLRANLSWYDRIIPYGIFGLGFYKPNFTLDDNSPATAVLFGLHMGPGVDLQLTSQLYFGAAITWHDVFSGGTHMVATTKGQQNVDMGGTYTTFLLHAGFTF